MPQPGLASDLGADPLDCQEEGDGERHFGYHSLR